MIVLVGETALRYVISTVYSYNFTLVSKSPSENSNSTSSYLIKKLVGRRNKNRSITIYFVRYIHSCDTVTEIVCGGKSWQSYNKTAETLG